MRVSIPINTCELEDQDLRLMSQLGVDCLDFNVGSSFPGVREQGYPDLDRLLQLKRKIASWGMEINRVTLPDLTEAFLEEREEAEKELDHASAALAVFAEAGVPITRLRIAGDVLPKTVSYRTEQRGGAVARGERASDQSPAVLAAEAAEQWWRRFRHAFDRLVPAAEAAGVKLTLHPSDAPYPNTPLGGIGLHKVLDAYPSRNVGLVYCVGSRAEAGGSAVVLDEIHQFGRKGRIFLVHVRNLRGSLATAGGFEEAMLDDGDLNLPKILCALRKVGYSGCINPDHAMGLEEGRPRVEHPNGGWRNNIAVWSYSIGYLKALIAALDEFYGV